MSIQTAPAHTADAFNVLLMPKIVDWAVNQVRRFNADAIVACGHSGLAIAPAVSYLTRVPLVAVRKDKEVDACVASWNQVSANLRHSAERWVWLDDFVSTGGTLRNAAKAVWKANVTVSPAPVAILSYMSEPYACETRALGYEWDDSNGLAGLGFDAFAPELADVRVPIVGRQR